NGSDRRLAAMRRIRLIPQNREFFTLYRRSSGNVVEIVRLLVSLLERFPDETGALVSQIKDREHEGDRLTHELVSLLNRTFVTPFDRDDMYRLAGALDDICDHADEAADDIGIYGVKNVPPEARAQADVVLRAAEQLDQAIQRLEGFQDSSLQLASLRQFEDAGD